MLTIPVYFLRSQPINKLTSVLVDITEYLFTLDNLLRVLSSFLTFLHPHHTPHQPTIYHGYYQEYQGDDEGLLACRSRESFLLSCTSAQNQSANMFQRFVSN